jgi:hypothetical protein
MGAIVFEGIKNTKPNYGKKKIATNVIQELFYIDDSKMTFCMYAFVADKDAAYWKWGTLSLGQLE